LQPILAVFTLIVKTLVGIDFRVVPKKDVKKILERIDLLSACQQYFCAMAIPEAS
jgi:hypothetical protein